MAAMDERWPNARLAVILPCYNEAATIAAVVSAFRRTLPGATVYVFDNMSSDDTAAQARAAGAAVRPVRRRGKGHVVRRMFADVTADIYILADGDLTYDIDAAPGLIDIMRNDRADMVVGARQPADGASFPRGHSLGNRFFNIAANWLFDSQFTDILSGYRVMSRRFVKTFPAMSRGFEIETELNVHAIDLRVPVREAPVAYHARPAGSVSKLATIPDGLRILKKLVLMTRWVRPVAFFGFWALVFFLMAAGLAAPLVVSFLETGLVPRMPTFVTSVGLVLLGALSVVCGTVMDGVSRARHEAKRLHYLTYPAPFDDLA